MINNYDRVEGEVLMKKVDGSGEGEADCAAVLS